VEDIGCGEWYMAGFGDRQGAFDEN